MLDRRLAVLVLAAAATLATACKNPHAAETPDPANLWLLMPEGGTGGVSYSNWERHLKQIDRRADELGRRFDAHHFFQWALGLAYQGFPGGRPSFPLGSPHGTNAFDGSGFFYDAGGEVVLLAWAIEDPGLAQQARRPHQATIRKDLWPDGACDLWKGFLVCADTAEQLERATTRDVPVDGAAQARALGAKDERALSVAVKMPSLGLLGLFLPNYGVVGVAFDRGVLSVRFDYSADPGAEPREPTAPHAASATAPAALTLRLTEAQLAQQLARAGEDLPPPAVALLEQLTGTVRAWSTAGGARIEAAVRDEESARRHLEAVCEMLPTTPTARTDSSVCSLLVPSMVFAEASVWAKLFPEGLPADIAVRDGHMVVDLGQPDGGSRLAEPSPRLHRLLDSDATVVFTSRAFDLGTAPPATPPAPAPAPADGARKSSDGDDEAKAAAAVPVGDIAAADIVSAAGGFIPVTAGNVSEFRAAAATVMEVGASAWFNEKGGGMELLIVMADADPPNAAELYYSALSARRMGKPDKHRERLERLATEHPDTLTGQRARALLDGALGPRAGLLPLLLFTAATAQ